MLTTIERVQLYLGLTGSTDYALLSMLLEMADGALTRLIGRNLIETEYTNDTYDGTHQIINLKGFPILNAEEGDFVAQYNAGTPAVPNWITLPAGDYVLHDENGAVELLTRYGSSPRNLRFTYTAGLETVPKDIELICIKMTAILYNSRKSDGIGNESVEGSSIVWSKELSQTDKDIISAYSIKII